MLNVIILAYMAGCKLFWLHYGLSVDVLPLVQQHCSKAGVITAKAVIVLAYCFVPNLSIWP